MSKEEFFEERKTVEQVEESNSFAPKFDEKGLIPVITTDFNSGEVLMHGYMNSEALKKTIENKYCKNYCKKHIAKHYCKKLLQKTIAKKKNI